MNKISLAELFWSVKLSTLIIRNEKKGLDTVCLRVLDNTILEIQQNKLLKNKAIIKTQTEATFQRQQNLGCITSM